MKSDTPSTDASRANDIACAARSLADVLNRWFPQQNTAWKSDDPGVMMLAEYASQNPEESECPLLFLPNREFPTDPASMAELTASLSRDVLRIAHLLLSLATGSGSINGRPALAEAMRTDLSAPPKMGWHFWLCESLYIDLAGLTALRDWIDTQGTAAQATSFPMRAYTPLKSFSDQLDSRIRGPEPWMDGRAAPRELKSIAEYLASLAAAIAQQASISSPAAIPGRSTSEHDAVDSTGKKTLQWVPPNQLVAMYQDMGLTKKHTDLLIVLQNGAMRTAELADECECGPDTCRKRLLLLTKLQLVEQVGDRGPYQLGPKARQPA